MLRLPADPESLYRQRLHRYVTAMRGGKPDRVPVRPFVAEFTAVHTGRTCQQVTHDYQEAFNAVLECCAAYDWDAVVPNMVYVWTGLAQTLGLRYYAIPGIDVAPDVAFQYREPEPERAWMLREEYDELIADPVRFLYDTWLPRVAAELPEEGAPANFRSRLALVKSAWAMSNYFSAFGPQVERMRRETGTVSAISGMLKAPLDVLGDKFRGYLGLAFDLKEVPEKVQAACEALAPHLACVALSGLDPGHHVPIPIWMHRGCVPFVSYEVFRELYWPSLRAIVEEIWRRGNQTLFYAEGKWGAHLEDFAVLPPHSIIYHIDRDDPRECFEKLGGRFALSGGVPNALLAFGTPEQVRGHCRKLIEEIGSEGGYILDASAIVQNDAKVENVRAMTDSAREYGAYSSEPCEDPPPAPPESREAKTAPPRVHKGVCFPWEERLKELGPIPGDQDLCRRIWEQQEALAYFYIWHLVLSF